MLAINHGPGRNILAFSILDPRHGGSVVQAHGPITLVVDSKHRDQHVEFFTLDHGILASVTHLDHISLVGLLDTDDHFLTGQQLMERRNAGVHIPDLRFQSSHPVPQAVDLVLDPVGLLTRLQHEGRNRCNP